MQALIWIGVILLVLGILAWFVLRVTVYIGIFLFVAGLALLIWGALKARSTLKQ